MIRIKSLDKRPPLNYLHCSRKCPYPWLVGATLGKEVRQFDMVQTALAHIKVTRLALCSHILLHTVLPPRELPTRHTAVCTHTHTHMHASILQQAPRQLGNPASVACTTPARRARAGRSAVQKY